MATEDEGASSVEQSAEGGQSGRDRIEAYNFGLEINGGGIDAAVAVGGGSESRASLIGGKGRVLDKEELGADLEGAVGSLAAMHPDGGAVGDLLRGGEAVVGHREANPIHDIPELGVLGGVEHYLVATDGGTRGARHGVDGLDAVEEGELVALVESVVVVDDRLRELADGGVGIDSEGAETDAAHKDVGGVLVHADAGEAATRNLIGCEDSTAVEPYGFGDIDLDHVDVGLDEGVEDGHLGRQVFVATTEHAVELFVDGGEITPLGATVHLPCAAARDGGLDRQLADDGARASLTVEELAYLTTDFGVCSKDFSHCLINLRLNIQLLVFSAVRHVHLSFSFERRRKSTGVAKNGIGLCQLPVGVGGALRVRSGWGCREKRKGEEEQKGGLSPVVWGKSGWMG